MWACSHIRATGRACRILARHCSTVSIEVGRKSSVGSVTSRNHALVNEDTYIVEEFQSRGQHVLLGAVFDGHGGTEAAKCASSSFARHLSLAFNDQPRTADAREALATAMADTERDILQLAKEDERLQLVGSTATAAVLIDHYLTVANLGDSPALLYGVDGQAEVLSCEHKASDDGEAARVRRAGGDVFVVHGTLRLQGKLVVTRALGDSALKPVGLSAVPHLLAMPISLDHGFLLVCSDGLFDGITPDMAFRLAKHSQSPQEAARRMVSAAELGPDSRDSITALVIPLPGWDAMRASVEESEIYKFLKRVRRDTAAQEHERLFRFMMLLEAYLPADTSIDALTAMVDDFITTGVGDFGNIAFKVFDADCDGELARDEVESLLKMLGAPYTDEEMGHMFALADTDRNGTISLTEFRRALRVFLHFMRHH